jgi:hypothetical protein
MYDALLYGLAPAAHVVGGFGADSAIAQHGFRSVVFQASQDAQENPSGAGAAKAELAEQAAEAPCSPAPGLFCLAPRSVTTLRKGNTRYRLPPNQKRAASSFPDEKVTAFGESGGL